MDKIFVDKEGRRRKGLEVSCKACEEKFLTRKDQPAKFCSSQCRDAGNRRHVEVKCSGCHVVFERQKSKLRRSKSGLYFCSRKCKDNAQKIGGVKEIMPPHYGTGVSDYRKLFESHEMICSRCGYDEFECGVEIHHVDHNRENNKKSNLIPLCACCHRGLHHKQWALKDLKN